MKQALVAALSLALLTTLVTPATGWADSRFHGRTSGFHGRNTGGRGGGPGSHWHGRSFQRHDSFQRHGRSFHGHGFGHHRFFPSPFFSVIAPPVVWYSPPPLLSAPPLYYTPPVYPPQVVYAPPAYSPPPPPPPPRVVEYPGGRYELRGDGVTTPYTWVWIPNPPPPPPAPPAPPSAPPAGSPTSGDAPRARATPVYRWIDEQGIVHLTDRWDVVPLQYRRQANPRAGS